MFRTTHRRAALAASIVAVALAACTDDTLVAPDVEDDAIALSRSTSLVHVRDRAAAAPVRLEIDVRSGGPPWVAREVEIEDDQDQEEEVESRITAADPAAGTITLALGDLRIDVSAANRFRAEGVGDVSMSSFFDRVTSALAAGRSPGVELRRRLPSMPQAPDDPTFVPRDVRLDDDAEFGKLEMLVDDRHVVADSDSVGRLTVLGIEIVVDRSLGSSVGERTDRGDGASEVEGIVESVSPAEGRVRILGGPEFRIVAGTRVEFDDDGPSTLAQVADAVAAGHWVEVEGELVRDQDGGWVAVEVEFEIEDDVDDDVPGSFEFEGHVVAADPSEGSFSFSDGRSYVLDAGTRVDPEGDVFSLEEVASALVAGLAVEAEGHVLPDSSAPGGARVVTVKFETDQDDDDPDGDDGSVEFEGMLQTVDAVAGTFVLANGLAYGLTEATRFEADGDLFSLSSAAAALAQGKAVKMEGDAVQDSNAFGGWRVISLKIEVDD